MANKEGGGLQQFNACAALPWEFNRWLYSKYLLEFIEGEEEYTECW